MRLFGGSEILAKPLLAQRAKRAVGFGLEQHFVDRVGQYLRIGIVLAEQEEDVRRAQSLAYGFQFLLRIDQAKREIRRDRCRHAAGIDLLHGIVGGAA